MPRARRHHTVPAFYLRRFADSDDRIERMDKAGKRIVMSVKDATVEVDFYTLDTDEGPSDAAERTLSEIEDLAASAMRHMDSGETPTLDDFTGLCNFIALQVTRGPNFRDQMTDVQNKVLQMGLRLEAARGPERIADIFEQAIGRRPTDEELAQTLDWIGNQKIERKMPRNAAVLAMLETAAEFVEPFSKMRWKVATFDGPALFTSDRPVSLWVQDPHPFYGVGILTADEITLPISPSKAFVIYPQADRDAEGEVSPPSAGEIDRRTLISAHRWLFMNPGWMDGTSKAKSGFATPMTRT